MIFDYRNYENYLFIASVNNSEFIHDSQIFCVSIINNEVILQFSGEKIISSTNPNNGYVSLDKKLVDTILIKDYFDSLKTANVSLKILDKEGNITNEYIWEDMPIKSFKIEEDCKNYKVIFNNDK